MTKEPTFLIKKNPDSATYDAVTAAVKDNGNYCCCSLQKNPDTLCMCKEFREQQEGGFCHCGRFYKVKDYPTITIICAPEDEDHAIALASGLTTEGFVITLPFYYDSINYSRHISRYQELQRTKIAKADLVFVINSCEEAVEFLAEQIYWAEELSKKIIFEHIEEVKEDEDIEHQSV